MLKMASESFIHALLLFLGLYLKFSRWVAPDLTDRRGALSLRHRNRGAATVLVCEQEPYPV